MSQRRRNESYSLSPHGPPFPGVSCGFSLTLSLTHSNREKSQIHVLEEKKKKKKKREKGREGRRKVKANPPALLLYLFLLESEARESKASVLLGVFINLLGKKKKQPVLLVRREEPQNLSES